MTTPSPLTPPLELVHRWAQSKRDTNRNPDFLWLRIATGAAQWGWDQREPEIQAAADAELEACCEWVSQRAWLGEALRAARRPKSLSLKQQALAELEEIMTELHDETGSAFTASAIRLAPEQLND